MCMIDFGCYTNHSLGMSVAADYNENHYSKGRRYTFICDRYSVASFPELDALSRGISNNLRCGLEIDVSYENMIIPIKCIAVSDTGIKNLYRIVGRANGKALCLENLDDIREGVLLGFSDGYDVSKLNDYADFWYLTPSLSQSKCLEIYEAAKRSGKFLCAATNACYINEADEKHYRILQDYEDLGNFKNHSAWNHMLDEGEMFKRLDFLGHHAAWEILIDNPFKLLDPYWEFLSYEPFPVPWYGKEYILPFKNAVATVRELAVAQYERSGYNGNVAAEKRLKGELEHLKSFHAERLLLAYHISNNLREQNYRTLNKGWLGASFVAYLLGATNVDPIKHRIPWELYFATPDPKSYSVRHYVPEAMKNSRKELLESCLPACIILPCKHECDIPFHAKEALGKVLNDITYPLMSPEFTYELYESQEEWLVFPETFDADLAKGISTLSPRLLNGHIPIVELYVDKRMDHLKDLTSIIRYVDFAECIFGQVGELFEENYQKTGKALSRYSRDCVETNTLIFAEDFYNTLITPNGIHKDDAVRLANNVRKGLYSSEKYRGYIESHPHRHLSVLAAAGYPQTYFDEVLSRIEWLCPKSEAIEETIYDMLLEMHVNEALDELGGEDK